ncbi:Fe3+-siderophore ABC transporter permease [Corynebacterium suranareeae]|uniref:Fe3+-siderophore ABC transporter permease n=1 Tax=Corynebacterium suranareeae TaxID=2506452 RepID=A0A160PML0_9CORY|nr:iron chelate uptake ABC transporter family permease subunit [Corynebacterium suranareeae]BAU94524.1 Fe3+-siderophore ABC transporter permease [Corynebacterium suranareeae]
MTYALSTKAPQAPGIARNNSSRLVGLIIALVVLVVIALISIAVGSRDISLMTIWNALWSFDINNDEHVMIRELRLPRTLVAIIVGPALGLCGALIQAFTRNPLADPGILGVNAGASFAVTVGVGVFGIGTALGYIWFALIGAALITILVYMLGSIGAGAASPVKLTLAGVAIGALLGGMTSAITLANRSTFDDLRFWGVGSVAGRQLDVVVAFTPFIVIGIVIAFAASRQLNALALGDELATSLGVKINHIRVWVIIAVTLLAGTATALAGPIGFVGLMVPHVVRWFTGPDQRWIMAYTTIVSAILLVVSDVIGRIILPNGELRVGLVTAIVGAPVLIILARRKSVSGL